MKKRTFIFYFVLLGFYLHAQIPNRQWSTYHGGDNEDSFRDMAIDANGYVYVVGSTRSTNAIITQPSSQSVIAGGSDAFVAKYDTDGNRIWSTYFGGEADDFGQSIDVDANGNIFITGLTFSANGIATAGTHQPLNRGNGDTFVAKLTNNGVVVWGTYLGGTNFDFANDIEIDIAGNPIIIGWTNSPTGISTAGAFQPNYGGQDDVIFAKFNTNGQLLWATYFGDSGFDTGLQVESDATGNITISGWTSSNVNIASPGAYQTVYGGNTADTFLAVFRSNGSRLWSTYYGGSGDDYGDALLVTPAGDIYLSGSTNSANNIATPAAFQTNVATGFDVFLARFTATGNRTWATYFGGNGNESAYRLRQGTDTAIYMTGNTASSNVMATPNAFQPIKSGGVDAFLSRFETDGRLTWSTYYGGSFSDFGYGLVLDADDHIFIHGNTQGSTNLATNNAVQTSYGGGMSDGFVTKFAPCTAPVLNFTNSGYTCGPVNYIFELALIGQPPYTIYYSIDGVAQTPWTTNNASFFPTVNANLWTDIIRIDSVKSGNCQGVINSTFGFVQVRDSIQSTNPVITCDDATDTYTVSFNLSGGAFGNFSSVGTTTGFINATDQFVSLPLPYSTPYSIQIVESGTFADCDTITFAGVSGCLDPCPPLSVTLTSNSPVCAGSPLMLIAGTWAEYRWSGPNGFTSILANPVINVATPNEGGLYTVTVTDTNGCTGTASTTVVINQPASGSISSNSPVCFGDNIVLSVTGGAQYLWSGPSNFSSTLANPVIPNANNTKAGTYIVTVTDTQGCTRVASVTVSVTNQIMALASYNGPLCTGAMLSLTASGGVSYAWAGPNGFTNNTQNPNINNATIQNAGTYIVTVTAANSCQATASVEVVIHGTLNVSSSSNTPVCTGNSILLMASGGTTYQWSGPNGFTNNTQNPVINNATILNQGIYVVTVTDANGCSTTATANIVVNSGPIAIISSNSPVCNGGDIAFQLSGGVSYLWQGPNGFSSMAQNPVINNVTTVNSGTYTVTVSGQNGCTTTATTSVNVTGQLNATISSNSPVCEQDTLRLMVNNGMSFVWNGPNGFTSSLQEPIIPRVSLNAAGTYILTVSDASGCTGSRQIDVVIKAKPIAIINGDQEICAGNVLRLETSSSGTLQWSTQETVPAITVSLTANTTYTLVVDNQGCKDTASITVTVKSKPIVSLSVSSASINLGTSVQLTATGADEYTWTPTLALSCVDCPNPIATPKETTVYCVQGSVDGCVADTCINIVVLDGCQFIFPNIFSPNDDGNNDVWCSQPQACIVNQTLTIFDRWGNLVHQTTGSEVCWDGGNNIANNVYTYLLQLIKQDGKKENIAGTITLVR